MQEIRLRNDALSFPPFCPCCLVETSDTRHIRAVYVDRALMRRSVKEKKVRVPYCKSCSRHVDWSTGGGYLGLVLSVFVNAFLIGMLGSLIASMIRLGSASDGEGIGLPGIVIAVACVIVIVFLAWRRLQNRPSGPVGPGHTRVKEAVELAKVSGNELLFRVHNATWAQKLLAMHPLASA